MILAIAILTTIACVLPGVFLVLRRMSLMSDAISHAILLGIVLGFFWTESLSSPLLMLGATLAGMATVIITEMIVQSKRLKEDAAIGLVFPAFFALAIILINQFSGDVHLDTDAVLLGELAFAPFHRLTLLGWDLGPSGLWVSGLLASLNSFLVWRFYPTLTVSTFDPALSDSMGISSRWMHYGLMLIVSLTTVGAFQVVGSILVVALMIVPAATAYLMVRRLSHMVWGSILSGISAVVSGYLFASHYDLSLAGCMAVAAGLLFIIALCVSPRFGILPRLWRFQEQKVRFASDLLLVQLLSHEGTPSEASESTTSHMIHHMGWSRNLAGRAIRHGVSRNYIQREKNQLQLTPLGREMARRVMRY